MKLSARITAVLAIILLVGGVALPPLYALDRYSGSDRYATAAAISQAGWDEGAEAVVLARGDVFADALAGVTLAHANEAPILLTKPDQLPPVVKAEISRLGAKKIFLLGGPAAISAAVAAELEEMELEVIRVKGNNRYGTAAEIAALIAPEGATTVFLAYGENFPDALAAASYAAKNNSPILLTRTDVIPAETLAALEALSPAEVIVIGGDSVIGDAVVQQLENSRRLKGANRYATAVALAEEFAADQEFMYIASGENEFAGTDALAGAALAAKKGTGILLVGKTLPAEVAGFLGKKVRDVVILGGESAISAALAQAIEDALYKLSIYNETDKTYHETIEDAIEKASAGSIIRITGEVDGFVLNKPLTIMGGAVNSTVIPATSGNVGIYVPAGVKGVVLEDLQVIGTEGARIGIETGANVELTVRDTEISGFVTGIYLNPGSKLTAQGNKISEAVAGIGSEKADLAEVSGNTFTDCSSEGVGLYLPINPDGTPRSEGEAKDLVALLAGANTYADCEAAVKLYGEPVKETGIVGLDADGKRVGFFDTVAAALANEAVKTILLTEEVDGFVLNRAVTIKGGTVNSTVIPATSGHIGIYVPAGVKGAVLDGVKINGADGAKIGIEVGANVELTVKDSVIEGFNTGIYLNPGSKLTAGGNTVAYALAGIGSDHADLSGVTGNTFNACLSEGIGLYLPLNSDGNVMARGEAAALADKLVAGNTFNYCRSKINVYGELLEETPVEGQDENGIRVGFYADIAAAQADDRVAKIILSGDCDGFIINRLLTIVGGNITPALLMGETAGIYVTTAASGTVIEGVTITGTVDPRSIGIVTQTGVQLTVKDSMLTDLTTGIYLNPGSKLTATDNTISNTIAGIGSESADLTGTVSGNTFADFESEAIGLYLPIGSRGGLMTEDEAETLAAALEEANGLEAGDVVLYGEFPTELKVVQDSGKNSENKENERPYFEYEVQGREITLKFFNPTNFLFAFNYRVDGEEGRVTEWSGTIIAEGELAGQEIGPSYHIVNLPAGESKEVKVTAYKELWVGLRLGAEQNWFLDWIKFQFK